MNKKGVEGLPLKYIIIVLIAVIILAVILDALDIISLGIYEAVFKINDTLANATGNLG